MHIVIAPGVVPYHTKGELIYGFTSITRFLEVCWKIPEPLHSLSVPRDKKINKGLIKIEWHEGIWQTDGEGTRAVLNYRVDTVGYARIHVPIDFIDALGKKQDDGTNHGGKGTHWIYAKRRPSPPGCFRRG